MAARYAIAREPGRIIMPRREVLPTVMPEAPAAPSATILYFVPTAIPEAVGAPREVIEPQAVAPAIQALTLTPTRISGVPAVTVGVKPGGSTDLTMVAADMWNGPRSDITQFRIISIRAGSWE